ncbi:MAG TPA: hypothetical protein VK196_01720 [Magnetospirillum sp.]|nr:hypothetical protein [Magnetospirillum sp.]
MKTMTVVAAMSMVALSAVAQAADIRIQGKADFCHHRALGPSFCIIDAKGAEHVIAYEESLPPGSPLPAALTPLSEAKRTVAVTGPAMAGGSTLDHEAIEGGASIKIENGGAVSALSASPSQGAGGKAAPAATAPWENEGEFSRCDRAGAPYYCLTWSPYRSAAHLTSTDPMVPVQALDRSFVTQLDGFVGKLVIMKVAVMAAGQDPREAIEAGARFEVVERTLPQANKIQTRTDPQAMRACVAAYMAAGEPDATTAQYMCSEEKGSAAHWSCVVSNLTGARGKAARERVGYAQASCLGTR